MAHADYHCCAICDCKMEYAGFAATTKEKICENCLKKLRDMGLNIITVDELMDWIRNEDKNVLRQKLKELGFRFCWYSNPVDELVRERLGDVTEFEWSTNLDNS